MSIAGQYILRKGTLRLPWKIYSDKAQYDTARFYYLKSVELAKGLGYSHGLDDCHIAIGYTYLKENNLHKALNHYQKALEIPQIENDKLGIAESLSSIAGIHYQEKQYQKALDLALKSLDISRETLNPQGFLLV